MRSGHGRCAILPLLPATAGGYGGPHPGPNRPHAAHGVPIIHSFIHRARQHCISPPTHPQDRTDSRLTSGASRIPPKVLGSASISSFRGSSDGPIACVPNIGRLESGPGPRGTHKFQSSAPPPFRQSKCARLCGPSCLLSFPSFL